MNFTYYVNRNTVIALKWYGFKKISLLQDTPVEIIKTRGDYDFINTGKVQGWVKSSHLSKITIPTPPIEMSGTYLYNFVVPSDGVFYKCRHDYECPAHNYIPRAGRKAMPETIQMLSKEQFTPLNKQWQEFWFGLLVKMADGQMTDSQLIDAWASLTADKRAFTDRHAVQNGFCDYILGKNLGAKPIAIKALSCGGNIVKVLRKGSKRIDIATLDSRNDPPKVDDIWGNWSLIHFATECVRFPEKGYPDKSYVVSPFPQLKDLGDRKLGVPFPIITNTGANQIFPFLLKPIANGQAYSPYNPIPK